MSLPKIRVLLADDQQIILDGLQALIQQNSDLEVCGLASNGREAVSMTRRLKPDVVLMDINMPEMDGIEATRAIKKLRPKVRILVLSMYNHTEFVHELLAAGANGYVLKNTGMKELFEAIATVMSGTVYLAEPVRSSIETRSKATENGRPAPSYSSLTKREKEVVKLMLAEMTSHEIATALSLSQDTVETHKKNIFSKLDIHTTAGIVRYAMERGWGELH